MKLGTKPSSPKIDELLCVLYCMWSAWPFLNGLLGKSFGLIIFILWILVTGNFLSKIKNNWELICIVSIPFALIPYKVIGNLDSSLFRHVGVYLFFFIGMFFYHYYCFIRKDFRFLGRIALASTLFFTIGAIQTLIGLLVYPNASRLLATSELDPHIRNEFLKMGIGGYGYIYSACFLVICLFYLLMKNIRSMRLSYYLFLLVSAIALILAVLQASYAISIFIMFFGIIVSLISDQKRIWKILIVIILFALFIVQRNLETVLKSVIGLFTKNLILHSKILDMIRTYTGGLSSGTSTSYRINLYLGSLRTFFKYPLFGSLGPFGDTGSFIGDHSGWFDLTGRYGIFLSFPILLAIYIYFNRLIKWSKNLNQSTNLSVVFTLFIAYGILDPVFSIHQLGLMVFLISPSVYFITELSLSKESTPLAWNSLT